MATTPTTCDVNAAVAHLNRQTQLQAEVAELTEHNTRRANELVRQADIHRTWPNVTHRMTADPLTAVLYPLLQIMAAIAVLLVAVYLFSSDAHWLLTTIVVGTAVLVTPAGLLADAAVKQSQFRTAATTLLDADCDDSTIVELLMRADHDDLNPRKLADAAVNSSSS